LLHKDILFCRWKAAPRPTTITRMEVNHGKN
jgi:hypothetical protein